MTLEDILIGAIENIHYLLLGSILWLFSPRIDVLEKNLRDKEMDGPTRNIAIVVLYTFLLYIGATIITAASYKMNFSWNGILLENAIFLTVLITLEFIALKVVEKKYRWIAALALLIIFGILIHPQVIGVIRQIPLPPPSAPISTYFIWTNCENQTAGVIIVNRLDYPIIVFGYSRSDKNSTYYHPPQALAAKDATPEAFPIVWIDENKPIYLETDVGSALIEVPNCPGITMSRSSFI